MPMNKKDLFDPDSSFIQTGSVLAGGSSQPFVGSPVYRDKPLTHVLTPITDDDGNVFVQEKVLESIANPLEFLSYDDYRLSKLLASGVKPQSIKIVPDHRIGVDDIVITQFNDHLDELLTSSSYETTN